MCWQKLGKKSNFISHLVLHISIGCEFDEKCGFVLLSMPYSCTFYIMRFSMCNDCGQFIVLIISIFQAEQKENTHTHFDVSMPQPRCQTEWTAFDSWKVSSFKTYIAHNSLRASFMFFCQIRSLYLRRCKKVVNLVFELF